MTGPPVPRQAAMGEGRTATLTSEWLVNYIREHGGAMTVTHNIVVD